jgi:hypothetical protein
MNARRWAPRVGTTAVAVAALVATWAMPADAHEVSGFMVSCSTVQATISDTGTPDPNDHPMVWNVRIGSGPFEVVASAETNVGGPGEDTVTLSGDISLLTANLAGDTATVEAFVSFPDGVLPPITATVTCGTAPITPTPVGDTPLVSPEVVSRSAPGLVAAPSAAAASPVAIAPRLTG